LTTCFRCGDDDHLSRDCHQHTRGQPASSPARPKGQPEPPEDWKLIAARTPANPDGMVASLTSIAAAAGQECAQRRADVLAHPDLAARLVAELGYQRPDQWNGFIPPATFNGAPNDSPRRAALMLISAEAWKREHPS
jgi:hypothetical protein